MDGYITDWSAVAAFAAALAAIISAVLSARTLKRGADINYALEIFKSLESWRVALREVASEVLVIAMNHSPESGKSSDQLPICKLGILLDAKEPLSAEALEIARTITETEGDEWQEGKTPASFVVVIQKIIQNKEGEALSKTSIKKNAKNN